MAFVVADRVQETTTTTGTGTLTLAGAVSGSQSFAAIGNANTTYYAVVHTRLNEWEVGLGTYTSSGTTLARTTVIASSNSNAAVNFSAGTKKVFCVQAAPGPTNDSNLAIEDANGYAFRGQASPNLLPAYYIISNGASVTYPSNQTGSFAVFTSTPSITLKASTFYIFELYYLLTKPATSTSHTISLAWGGTATITSIQFSGYSLAQGAGIGSAYDAGPCVFGSGQTAIQQIRAGYTTQNTTGIIARGGVLINAGGTFTPQLNINVSPGQSWSLRAGSYFKITPIGSSTGGNINIGGWA
jgi:hypothetical protein